MDSVPNQEAIAGDGMERAEDVRCIRASFGDVCAKRCELDRLRSAIDADNTNFAPRSKAKKDALSAIIVQESELRRQQQFVALERDVAEIAYDFDTSKYGAAQKRVLGLRKHQGGEIEFEISEWAQPVSSIMLDESAIAALREFLLKYEVQESS